ncbi:Endolytic murein transglycosylase [Austwickia sp. TVS 96-490-7B]|uniref:endolytic transglycosylase MltG n=1 Tax=Austwickia sp. TVS 96-490-7B TaxID=2830843 RepID=UPI001DC686F1|nr:endolytic transglycosylase MltG [Austwickia sp. TVS 96-490-7B]MBW3086008.1 Endolytic murein transglycosylase [Austwickia sp. TVS 96-490-7B]
MTDPLHESIFGEPEPPTRRQRRESRRGGHRSRRKGHGVLTWIAVMMVLALAGWFAVANFKPLYDSLSAPKDFEGEGGESVSIVVNPGDSGTQIAKTLVDAGVIKTPAAFTAALEANPGDEVQPGTYTLRKEMKASTALSMLRGTGREVVKVTIREGLWKSDVYAALSKATGIPKGEYEAAEKAAASDPGSLGLPASSKGNPEGWLFPATYSFDKKSSAANQLKELIGKTKEELTGLGVNDDQSERILTIASIIEAESRFDPDRPKVARVILNRLAKPMPLQMDSTVSYGVQRRSITTTDQERAAKNGYNTYANPGLPAGPIGNPGTASVKAAVSPASGPWLYFVAVNPETGETNFATTMEEHNRNVLLFQKWCQSHPGKC